MWLFHRSENNTFTKKNVQREDVWKSALGVCETG